MHGSSLFLIDAIKALASQLIVWHHFAVYSPMSDAVYPHARGVIDWLYRDARLAVQAFLVVGGFLAARSLAPQPDAVAESFARNNLARRLWSRYLRLALPYVAALVFAIACAAFARSLTGTHGMPAAPSVGQVAAHIFLLQDIANVDVLSAGVWYVAIDFQLYALLAVLLWWANRLAIAGGAPVGRIAIIVCSTVAAISLFWLNRDRSLDLWGPYFFGAYGLGVLAQWASVSTRKRWWLAGLALLAAAALALDWRDRVLVASVTALVLAGGAGAQVALRGLGGRIVEALGRISYPLFLVHYPVSLVVGAVMLKLGSHGQAANWTALCAAWVLSLGAGFVLQRLTESGATRPARQFAAGWAKAY